MHSFISSFIHSLIHSSICSIVHSFIHSCIHSFIDSFMHLFDRSLIHSCICSIVHSFIHSCIHSFIDSFMHLFDRSFIHSLVHSLSSTQNCNPITHLFTYLLCTYKNVNVNHILRLITIYVNIYFFLYQQILLYIVPSLSSYNLVIFMIWFTTKNWRCNIIFLKINKHCMWWKSSIHTFRHKQQHNSNVKLCERLLLMCKTEMI